MILQQGPRRTSKFFAANVKCLLLVLKPTGGMWFGSGAEVVLVALQPQVQGNSQCMVATMESFGQHSTYDVDRKSSRTAVELLGQFVNHLGGGHGGAPACRI